jgi:hypothetical protein
MEETIKNVISDLQYKVDVLKQEKQYLLDMCRNCETCRTAILLPVLQE